ncbi:MAG: hypothetical protein BWY76_01905 [bacterium ADurb.Bin429]|nr:MAG: hypothetical protein BWY76_01905 [bacterium ADurb.Bin429]
MKLKFGYGTVIALIIAAVLIGTQVYQKRQAAARGPVVERQVHGMSHGVAPTPEYALRYREALHLTEEQVTTITALATAYRKEVAPVHARLNTAARTYENYMERTAEQSRPKTQEVTGHSGEVQRLSGVLATTRHAYWARVLAALTAPQRQTAQQLATQAKLTDLQ